MDPDRHYYAQNLISDEGNLIALAEFFCFFFFSVNNAEMVKHSCRFQYVGVLEAIKTFMSKKCCCKGKYKEHSSIQGGVVLVGGQNRN